MKEERLELSLGSPANQDPGSSKAAEQWFGKEEKKAYMDTIPLPRYEYKENEQSKKEAALRYDGGKPRYDLISVYALDSLARVLEAGAKKYEPRNWEKGFSWSRAFASCMRHLWAFWKGEDNDKESNLPHLAHAMCNIMFLLELSQTHKELDDRVKHNG